MMRLLYLVLLMSILPNFGFAAVDNPWSLMPMPKEIQAKEGKFRILRSFTVNLKGPEERLNPQATRFLRRLDDRTGLFFEQHFLRTDSQVSEASLQVEVQKAGVLKLGVDESYRLSVAPEGIRLTAPTDIGALRGMETLLQLVQVDENGYYFPAVEINDAPRFPWRGLMMDPSRHFMPVDVLKRNLNAMASAKLNVLHLHLSDNQGFRIESKVLPALHEKGSDGEYYTQQQIREVIAYAGELGIRVMPEFDVPGHATAILMAYPEIGSAPAGYEYKMEVNAGVFDPTLDPTNEKTYELLEKLFAEMASLFPDEYFHIGGDENKGLHWKENPRIQQFMKKNKLKDNHELQLYFSTRISKMVKRLGKHMVGWDEIYTPELPKETLVHGWRNWQGMDMYQAAKKGYKMIVSSGYYIDLMKRAESHYLNDPLGDKPLKPSAEANIMGGEATMWSELVTARTVDSRIWPRTAAIAERFWSPKHIRDVDDMYRRMDLFSMALEIDGILHIHSKEAIMRKLCR
ncbi:MAG: beta-N-acetylhexosaminidase, partial [Cytophagales bacterium]|nr:beta-N-acetylhexosaminidase [Cytophagales bacterium]